MSRSLPSSAPLVPVSRARKLAQRHEATEGIDRFVFIDRLPVDRRHNAKIDRPALATRFSDRSRAAGPRATVTGAPAISSQ
jgi:hypothetical protein